MKTWGNGDTPNYTQTAVTVEQMRQDVAANALAWAAEIEKRGRVPVYGLTFDTGKSTIRPDSEAALKEIVRLPAATRIGNCASKGTPITPDRRR